MLAEPLCAPLDACSALPFPLRTAELQVQVLLPSRSNRIEEVIVKGTTRFNVEKANRHRACNLVIGRFSGGKRTMTRRSKMSARQASPYLLAARDGKAGTWR